MAYAALASLSQTLKLVQHEDRIHILFGGRNNNDSLDENIMRLLKFLEDFPAKYAPSVRPLEDRIRDAAYELEDHIERFVTLSQKFPPESTDAKNRNSLIPMLDTHIQGVKLLTECVDSILKDAMKVMNIYTTQGLSTSINTFSSASGSSRHAPSGKETMIGVNNDLIQIKDRVTGYELNLQIIPIIGIGGIGKTTLARNVFEDPLIEQHFDVRSWATVSHDYHVREVLERLLSKEQLKWPWAYDESLIEYVYKSLKNRRYLIVLDDMWHSEVWDHVRRAFPDDNNGSRVIITTRLSDLAATIDSSSPLHRMQLLNEDQSWALLWDKVFGQEICPQQLEEVGKVIAKGCKGLPLTIVVISGLLKVNKTKDYWDSVAENIKEAIGTNGDEFFATLSLSYENLPHHLKACFLYMGIFPEDYRIPIDKLFMLWVAEGFLKPARLKSLEEVAEEYLEDLVNRSLVSVTKKRSNGKIKFCIIHDALRELSIKKGHEEKFLQRYRYGYHDKYDLLEIPNMHRRLIIHTTRPFSLPDDIHDSPIRSLLYFTLSQIDLSSFTSNFLLLRVVDGLKIIFDSFPGEILHLVNLRYVAFTCYNVTFLIPPTISKLKNLESLVVNKTSNFVLNLLFLKREYMIRFTKLFMPSEIWKMPKLRHLVLNRQAVLTIPDREKHGESRSILHNLQTLDVRDLEFTMDVIERLPNLKKLGVNYREPRPENSTTWGINNLVYLHHLEELKFEWAPTNFEPNVSSFPQNLEKLSLNGSRIPWEKMFIVSSLPKLKVLKLKVKSFIGREWEITEEFSSLKHLEMAYIDLEEWIVESNNFPCLERLIIRRCQKLKEVPESIGDISTLQLLTVEQCNLDVEASVRNIQVQQQSVGNDDLEVQIIPMDESIVRL